MTKRTSLVLGAIPVLALTLAIPFVNFDEPRMFGLPFVLAWIVAWTAVTPAFLWIIHRRIEGRR
jgi:hypothetical protein